MYEDEQFYRWLQREQSDAMAACATAMVQQERDVHASYLAWLDQLQQEVMNLQQASSRVLLQVLQSSSVYSTTP